MRRRIALLLVRVLALAVLALTFAAWLDPTLIHSTSEFIRSCF